MQKKCYLLTHSYPRHCGWGVCDVIILGGCTGLLLPSHSPFIMLRLSKNSIRLENSQPTTLVQKKISASTTCAVHLPRKGQFSLKQTHDATEQRKQDTVVHKCKCYWA